MTATLGRLARQSVFAYRALFGWLKPRDYLILKILEPFTQILFFAFLSQAAGTNLAFVLIGNAVRTAAMSGIFGCASVMHNEQRSGTLPAIIASPASAAQTFFARSLLQGVDGLTTVGAMLAVAAFGFGVDFSRVNVPWMALALLVTSYSLTSLGMALSTAGLLGADVNFTTNVVYMALMVICGVNFPVSDLPGPVQAIAQLVPLTHGLQAVRGAMAGDLSAAPIAIGLEAMVCGAYGALAFALFRWAEHRARVRGVSEME